MINGILGNTLLNENLRFYNRGISGNRVADLYGRWKEDCLNLNPDILSILIGINECYSAINSNSGSDPERFAKIYRLMLELLQRQVHKISEEYGAIFVPLQNKFNELCQLRDAEYWIWDGIHPTVCGHYVIAQQWISYTMHLFQS